MSRKLLYWLLIGCIVTVGSGAAVGTVLEEFIRGNISVTVSQAILVEKPTVTKEDGSTWPHRFFTSVTDDGTKFSAAVEAYRKETFVVNLPIKNKGTTDLITEFFTLLFLTARK